MAFSFLSDRRQCVHLNIACSTSYYFTSGIIQSGVLGPLLFTMYINELPAQCPCCKIMLFADDVKAYKRIRSPSDSTVLQVSLNNLCCWTRGCELGISTDRCYMLLPSARLSKLNSNLQIERRHYCFMYVYS